MTVNYDAKDHLGVIFRIHGSVLPSVLPWCAYNVAVACLVWWLRSSGTIDATFDGGLGYQYISILVSFFVVTNVNTTYNRFWEARGYLGDGLFAISKLALRAALYSGKETHEMAKMWRKILRARITRLLQYCMFIIQHDRASVINKLDHRVGDISERELLQSRMSVLMQEEFNHDARMVTLAFAVDAAIRSHADFLENPLQILEQMDLLGKVSSFLDAYDGLIKNSTTPRPFPSVQMGRTLLIVWILSLPFVLGHLTTQDLKGLFHFIFIVFIVTYGFVGLMCAEIEMHDPYGSDANDLEVDKYTSITQKNIDTFLADTPDLSYGFDFQKDAMKEMRTDAITSSPTQTYGAL